jgi:hypothetical protein
VELNGLHHRILFYAADCPPLYELLWPYAVDLANGQWEPFGEASVAEVQKATRELALAGYVGLSRSSLDREIRLNGAAALQAIDDPRNWAWGPSGTGGDLSLWTTPEGREAYNATWEMFGGPERNARYHGLVGDDEKA